MTIKADRNGPCYCGSGIKYKKCCLLSTNKVILSTSTDIEIIEHAIGIKNNSYHHIKRLIVNHQVLRKWYFFGFEVAIVYATNIRKDKVEKAVIEAYS